MTFKILLPNSGYSKQILKLALPVIAGLSTQMILSLVDTAMVGRLENPKYTLAAMGLGLLATWAVVSVCSSLSTGTHVLVARRFGEQDYNAISGVLFNSLLLTFVIGSLLAVLGWQTALTVSDFLSKDNQVAEYAAEYMKWRYLGLPFFMITVSFRGFFFGTGNTKIFMFSAILINLLNILFNYAFIFGKFGAPKMGIAGASFASSLATMVDAIYYFVVFFGFKEFRVVYRFSKNLKLIPKVLSTILKLSIPVSFQNVFILIGFLSFIAITGLLGITQQAASQAIISTLFLSFLPSNGFGVAGQTLVGNSVGKGDIVEAKKFGYETAKLASIYTLSLAVIFIFVPEALLYITTNESTVIEAAIPAMRFAGVAQIFFGAGVVLAYGLQSVGKTTFVMFVEVFTNLMILVPFAYFIGVYLEFGLPGAWSALILYTTSYLTLMFLKFHKGNWNNLEKI
ncbi:MAG: MATE family efflux transporter [Ignavibacteriales bacterium]|nr:MAG: MATE family efflux transporter [Ignavibacteriaceae bacterium]MBW7871824.1 MATE family efflux transporter [Ignavibacteria bacterium]MCZ2144326.1 MATE family efflux transporter [Ignavibacteriales bacterium]OQY79256.1 MAG: MATE family efflux transporter [Ignavibacteriales bacterium UTCHB3]MBV6446279.1 putative FMN/FAD exporter YeeO [Ignavibacteriaceae bacterium]